MFTGEYQNPIPLAAEEFIDSFDGFLNQFLPVKRLSSLVVLLLATLEAVRITVMSPDEEENMANHIVPPSSEIFVSPTIRLAGLV
ncbi:hypothetical protein C942_01503 [Photobacterium marinum]|uniref:Uncharacterized protein n=1 Tax=Photobacterium marinum TaxID=1056511 RepID=L8JH40_9GAMM|nr:hypothetical protein C942_01503 [Photobacterium marinum]